MSGQYEDLRDTAEDIAHLLEEPAVDMTPALRRLLADHLERIEGALIGGAVETDTRLPGGL